MVEPKQEQIALAVNTLLSADPALVSEYKPTDSKVVEAGKTYYLYNMADNGLLIGAPGVYADSAKTTFSAILSNTYVDKADSREITVPSGYCFIRLSYVTADA